MKFTHNTIVTLDVEAILAFYARWCGTKLVRDRIVEEDGLRVAWIAAPESTTFVFVVIETKDPAEVSPIHTSLLSHYGFLLESKDAVDALHADMKAAGIEVNEPKDHEGVVGYIFFAKDPDGRNIEFASGQDVSDANWQIPSNS